MTKLISKHQYPISNARVRTGVWGVRSIILGGNTQLLLVRCFEPLQFLLVECRVQHFNFKISKMKNPKILEIKIFNILRKKHNFCPAAVKLEDALGRGREIRDTPQVVDKDHAGRVTWS